MEYFPGFTSLQILQKIQEKLNACQTRPEEFEDRTIFMSMFNDIDWRTKENSEESLSNSGKAKNYAKTFPRGHWSFLGPREKDKWYGTHTNKRGGQWNSTADVMVEDLIES